MRPGGPVVAGIDLRIVVASGIGVVSNQVYLVEMEAEALLAPCGEPSEFPFPTGSRALAPAPDPGTSHHG